MSNNVQHRRVSQAYLKSLASRELRHVHVISNNRNNFNINTINFFYLKGLDFFVLQKSKHYVPDCDNLKLKDA